MSDEPVLQPVLGTGPDPEMALFAALAAAQGEFPVIPKARTVKVQSAKGNYSFDYAPLDVILAAVRPVLAKHGLSFVQTVHTESEFQTLRTTLMHVAGARVVSDVPMPQLPQMPQQVGSQLTYFRRYSLTLALGIAAEEDDDGNGAQDQPRQMADRRTPPPRAATPAQQPAPAAPAAAKGADKPPAAAQLRELQQLLNELKPAEDNEAASAEWDAMLDRWFQAASKSAGREIVSYDEMRGDAVAGIIKLLKTKKANAGAGTSKPAARPAPRRTVAV